MIVPMLLTDEPGKIKLKLTLCCIMLGISFVFLGFKIWAYVTSPVNLIANTSLLNFLGVYPGEWAETFMVDAAIVILSTLLIWHYHS